MITRYLRAHNGLIYDPSDEQLAFHQSQAKHRWGVGGVGSGKSCAGCVEAFLTAMEYPGSEGLVGRWGYRDLTATTWRFLKKIVPRELVADSCESIQKTYLDLYAPEGKISRIWGWHLSNTDAIHSLELDWAFIDEADKIPLKHGPELWSLLDARLRGGPNKTGPLRMWVTGNPNGRDWLWRLFVQKGFREYQVIRMPTGSNSRYQPDGYEQRLRRTNSREWARRYLDAEFNEFEGAVLWNWDERVHVIDPFPVPKHWPLFLSVDPGMADACAALLLTSDEAGNVFVVNEYYDAGKTISQQCEAILRMVGARQVEWTVIDPSTRRRDEAVGTKRIDLYRQHGLPNVQEANNSLLDGIAVLQEGLQVEASRAHPVTQALGAPRFYVFRHCGQLRNEIGGWRWGPNGKPLEGDDHCLDAWRYGVMRRPHAAQRQESRVRNPFWTHYLELDRRPDEGAVLIGAGPGGTLGAPEGRKRGAAAWPVVGRG